MKARLAPFLDLLDVRYLPLLAVIAPQSYTVYAWLLGDGAPMWVAALGGFGFESVYVGAVAWAERGTGWGAARPPAVTALLFSVAVSVAHYAPTVGALAILHAGFPIVAYAYTVTMHAHRGARQPHDAPAAMPKVSAPELKVVTKWDDQIRRERLRANGGSHTEEQWRNLCAKFGHRCVICGEQHPLVRDHIIPVYQGGSDDISNIQPTCVECNSRKGEYSTDFRARTLTGGADVTGSDVIPDRLDVSKRRKVSAIAKQQGITERTVWRKVKAGKINLDDITLTDDKVMSVVKTNGHLKESVV